MFFIKYRGLLFITTNFMKKRSQNGSQPIKILSWPQITEAMKLDGPSYSTNFAIGILWTTASLHAAFLLNILFMLFVELY